MAEGTWGGAGAGGVGRTGCWPSPRSLAPAAPTAQPGAVVSSSPCETCRCQVPSGPLSGTFVINCETQTCSTDCPVVSTRLPCRAEPPAAPARPPASRLPSPTGL